MVALLKEDSFTRQDKPLPCLAPRLRLVSPDDTPLRLDLEAPAAVLDIRDAETLKRRSVVQPKTAELVRAAPLVTPQLAVLTAVLVLALLTFVRMSQGAPPASSWDSLAPAPAVATAPGAGETVRVVDAGDTLWAIAEEIAPNADPRVVVNALSPAQRGIGSSGWSAARDSVEPRRIVSAESALGGSLPAAESATVWFMRCHVCEATDTRVVDSRAAESGDAIRRRRECALCGSRFTTFERVEEAPLVVIKRDGERKPFAREKLIGGMTSAAKGRHVEPEVFVQVAEAIEDLVRANGGQVTSDFVGLAVLDHLRTIDEVAALRFASVYKHFDTVADFEREATLIKRESHPASKAAPDGLEASLN